MKDINNTEPKKMVDFFPIKKLTAAEIREKVFSQGGVPDATEFYSADEIEKLLQKLAQPKILTKAIGAFTFGRKITLDELLGE